MGDGRGPTLGKVAILLALQPGKTTTDQGDQARVTSRPTAVHHRKGPAHGIHGYGIPGHAVQQYHPGLKNSDWSSKYSESPALT